LYVVGNRLDLQEERADSLAIGLVNFGSSLQDTGQLAKAERAYQLSLAIAQAADQEYEVGDAHRYLVNLYSMTGAWMHGEIANAALQANPHEEVKAAPFALIYAARLRWGQGQDPSPLLSQGLERAREQRFLFAQREAQRLTGEVAFEKRNLTQAQEEWQAAYNIAQREGIPLGPYLADLARVHAAQQEGEQAKALIAEALALGGLHVSLAAVEVYAGLGEPAEANRFVDAAYREAWADGPPYAFYFELQRIRAALKILGLPEPQLQPFDPARVPPLPDEAEIGNFIEELKRERHNGSDEDEDDEDATQDGILALTPEIEPASPTDAATPTQRNGRRPWWKFWSQN
jgi:hypothetical protein